MRHLFLSSIMLLLFSTFANGQCYPIAPTLAVSGGTLCEGEEVTFVVGIQESFSCEVNIGAPYELTFPDGTVQTSATNTFQGIILEAGEYEARVEMIDDGISNGTCPCGTSGGFSINSNSILVNPVPLTPSVDTTDRYVCPGEQIILTAYSAENTGGEMIWTDGINTNDILYVGQSFTTPAITSPTTFQVYERLGDCISPVSAEVAVLIETLPPPVFANANIAICPGESTVLEVVNTDGNQLVEWYLDPLGVDGVLYIGSTFVTPPLNNSTVFYVRITDEGCESDLGSATVEVEDLAPPTVSNTSINVCEGDNALLSATASNGGVIYWYEAISGTLLGVGNQIEYEPDSTANSILVEERLGNCISEQVEITINIDALPPIPEIIAEPAICEGSSLVLFTNSFNNTYLYNWSGPNDFNSTDIEPTIPNSDISNMGYYQLQVTETSTGCRNISDEYFVEITPAPNPGLQDTIRIYDGEPLQLQASGGTDYQWLPTEYLSDSAVSNPIFTPPYLATSNEEIYEYSVNVSDGECESISTTTVIVVPRTEVVVYDVITPNDDGKNDEWFISFPANIKEYQIYVFDKHNQLIFRYEGDDYNSNRWNGRFMNGGKIVPNSSYFYRINISRGNEQCKQCTGMLSVFSTSNN